MSQKLKDNCKNLIKSKRMMHYTWAACLERRQGTNKATTTEAPKLVLPNAIPVGVCQQNDAKRVADVARSRCLSQPSLPMAKGEIGCSLKGLQTLTTNVSS
jgi:hypothetical protein